jgi:hypothetical protein
VLGSGGGIGGNGGSGSDGSTSGGSVGSSPGATLWAENFNGLSNGTDPSGWLDTGSANRTTPDDALFHVETMGGNRVYATDSEETNIHSHLVTRDSVHWSAYEFSGRMRITDANGGIGVTVLSRYPGEDAYYRVRRHQGAATEAFHMAPHPDGHTVACASASTQLVPKAGTWYRFRFQAVADAGSTALRAKVWLDGAIEPPAWQIDCHDDSASRLTEGPPGLWAMGPGKKFWDDLRVSALEEGGASGSLSGGGGTGSSGASQPPAPPVLYPSHRHR